MGIAFALGFTVGPALGAFFASIDLVRFMPSLSAYGINTFSAAAVVCWALLVIETIYIYFYFEETHPRFRLKSPIQPPESSNASDLNASAMVNKKDSSPVQIVSLNGLHRLNFWHSFFFSGLEFVLPFLTFQRFGFTNRYQGYLLGIMGLVASLIQGGYTRRYARKLGETRIATQGLFMAALGFQSWAIVGTSMDPTHGDMTGWITIMGVVGFAFASATVSTCLASLVSFHSEQDDAEGNQGERMGRFRSSGQLGRALGPLAACVIYWITNGIICFSIGAIGEFILALIVLRNLSFISKVKSE